MNRLMIKAIIFDFGQTLVDSASGFRLAEKKAKDIVFAEIRSGLGGLGLNDFLPQYRRIRKEFHGVSNFSRLAIWQEVYRYFGLCPDLKVLEDREYGYWEEVKMATKPFAETESVLKDLAKDYKLGLITNTQGQKIRGTHRLALFPELEKYFDAIIVAGEDGVPAKPDRQPFIKCLKQLGVSPKEAVFVGDDWRIDIQGAEKAGLKPVWLKHHSVDRNWPEIETRVPVIQSLSELLDISNLIKG